MGHAGAASNRSSDATAGRHGSRLPLALTMGDPAGIGPEIVLKAWAARVENALSPFVYYGDDRVLAARAQAIGIKAPVAVVSDPSRAADCFDTALPVSRIEVAAPVQPGKPDGANAPAVIAAIERAVADVAQGRVRAVVTAPIAKSVLYGAGFKYPGHTEFLAALARQHWRHETIQPVMMLACDTLRVVPATIHVPLKDVPPLITPALLCDTVQITWHALQRQFGISKPRIAVTGLNPHAGENGSIGREDIDVIAPVIQALRAAGLDVTGPHPADTLFHAEARRRYDAAVCMYHDQALIPIKTLAFDEGVNVTLGLPFVRTSPDHGTAFDIAARGCGRATSIIEALKLAGRLSQAAPSRTGRTREA
ncbi:MAG TPA: 4-hydroxythreonine-4-phosphate dehydrogenase PdxA [Hyphomicrobium sp.]|nr:4-hydroxythreonine-4-phosphate dehydrogenase PdxA [Hyphomicrobium sp.]